MIDISAKSRTLRTAQAEAVLKTAAATIDRIRRQDIPKGNPLEVAKIAAIQAAKETSRLIPYCHPVPVAYVGVDFGVQEDRITVRVTVKAIYRTGVEMEALTGASAAALTLYDMLKMVDDSLEIERVRLISKTGGKSDFVEHLSRPLTAAVLVMSDSVHAGNKADTSGKLIVDRLKNEGITVADYKIVPDEPNIIRSLLTEWVNNQKYDLVLTTGGTGFGKRDNAPEAMMGIIEREIPGIPEILRSYGHERTPYAMLSRGRAGISKNTIIINLPGSRRGVSESLNALFPGLFHAFPMLWGKDGWHKETVGGERT